MKSDVNPMDRANAAPRCHARSKRTGLPCRRCGTSVLTAVMAARNVFWCPQCQAD